jgi:hypothetical protein
LLQVRMLSFDLSKDPEIGGFEEGIRVIFFT